MSKTVLYLDLETVDQAAEILGTDSTEATVHAALRELVNTHREQSESPLGDVPEGPVEVD